MRTGTRCVWLNLLMLLTVTIVNSGCARPITVETVPQGSSKGNCGGFDWLVKFTLDKNSKAGGWIVQEFRYVPAYTSCGAENGGNPSAHYWEAWRVLPGQDHPATRDGFHRSWDDEYLIPEWDNSTGYNLVWGELRFFEGVTLPKTMIQNNPKTLAGPLHSDTEAPPFWETVSPDDTSPHNAFYAWGCCPSGRRDLHFIPDFARLLSPKPQPKTEPKQTAMMMEIPGQQLGPSESELMDKRGYELFSSPGGVILASFALQSETEQAEVAKLIETISPWTGNYGSKQAEELGSIATRVSVLPLSEIRKGVDEFVQRHRSETQSVQSLSKVYLLLRVLFDVPAAINIREAKVFGGWVNPSVLERSQSFNLMWPIAMDERFGVITVQLFQGYFGVPYDAVGEFDYFQSKFPLRKHTERAPR